MFHVKHPTRGVRAHASDWRDGTCASQGACAKARDGSGRGNDGECGTLRRGWQAARWARRARAGDERRGCDVPARATGVRTLLSGLLEV